MALVRGSRLGPYEVVAPIGRGGMGEVYRARDTRLQRDVAIKVLPAGVAEDDEGRRRFDQEARTIAALSHPNICQIYDVGAGYLVLEFIDGRPLSGPVSSEQASDLALQIACALQAAHARGIIHRDLKPANILVRDGSAKVLDFGLAKWLDGETVAPNTQAGMVLGTLAYMSPEQADGRPVDERSDIFSFGAIFYELLSGRRPFDGGTSAEIMGAVLHRDPPPLEPVTPLTGVVERCLAKTPSERFQTAGDLRSALERPARPAAAPRKPSIAVLPFADMSPGKDHEWFSDGLAEEIINALSHVRELKVIARTSAFAFKGKQDDVRRIAATLGVNSVLEGSVRRSGDRLRVTAQLINAADGAHLWSARYDRELSDVFEIQDEISRAIVAALEVTLLTAGSRRVRRPASAAAYDAYLKGRHYRFQFKHDSLRRSLELLEEAVALDPEFALARWEIAFTCLTLSVSGLMAPTEAAVRMRAEATRALALEPHMPEAHAAFALAAALEYDWSAAAASFRRALAVDSVSQADQLSPDIRLLYAQWYLVPLGRVAEALEQTQSALMEDPLNLFLRNSVGMFEICRGNEDRGVAAFRQLLDLNDRMFVPNLWLCGVALRHGRFEEALTLAERAYAIEPRNPMVIGTLAGALERTGDRERAERLRSELGTGEATASAGHVAYHLVRGDVDAAATWFERAIALRDPCTSWILPRVFGDLLTLSRHWPALATAMNLPTS
jgi:eukaryotic-like serine/threonine-protein kinase